MFAVYAGSMVFQSAALALAPSAAEEDGITFLVEQCLYVLTHKGRVGSIEVFFVYLDGCDDLVAVLCPLVAIKALQVLLFHSCEFVVYLIQVVARDGD